MMQKFGPVFVGAGALNFFGQGWPIHQFYKSFRGFDFTGSTFISKTVTFPSRMIKPGEEGKGRGNLVLNPVTLQPEEIKPDCIKTYFLSGDILNAIGLSGPGAKILFEMEEWQKITQPFGISFEATGGSKWQRLYEAKRFTEIFKKHLPSFRAPVFLEVNTSCPSLENCSVSLIEESAEHLEITSLLGIPQGIKINALTPHKSVKYVINSGFCNFIDIPNSLPFGSLPEKINWRKKFGKVSPLARYGGGGYSGQINFELAAEWTKKARRKGIDIPIILGGVFSKKDVHIAKKAGANAISFARVTLLRPWRVKGIIEEAYRVFGDGKGDAKTILKI